MRWTKLGLVFCPDNHFQWMRSHAANPVAEPLGDDRFRVYFSTRDVGNRSSIGFVEFDIGAPQHILRLSPVPVIGPGPLGGFDDSGTSMGCLTTAADGSTHLYYLGWNLGVTVPWRNSIGLAVRPAGDTTFHRASPAPVLDRNAVDPYSVSYPWILREDGCWRMWYGSNLSWGARQEDMAHVLKYALSDNGLVWRPTGSIAIGFQAADEYAMSKPCVIRDDDCYRMWYSFRGAAYRIGYAESADGVTWRRLDEQAGLMPSDQGWDAETVEYPCVFDHKGKRYLLYNGTRFGLSGFGLAVLELS